ncbi:MAG TPA: DUF4255 domain-containing protein [Polyangiaceae bacterium]|nr:DUF4255 domain-containing protein [Polyangiaceae bacterium]
MLSEALLILKDAVNNHLSMSSGWSASDSDHGQVVFLDSERVEALDFKIDAVSLVLVNVEEETTLRPDDPHRRALLNGASQKAKPPIHLNAYVLFVARFKDYKQSLQYISLILRFFLKNRLLDHESTPTLSDRIEKLTMELVTLPFSEQNHLWGILRTAYMPSLLYKVRMIVFQDEDAVVVPPILEPTVRIQP